MTSIGFPQSAQAVVEADLGHLTATLATELATMSGGRLLITGGAGFLGYYLVQAPLAWNDRRVGEPIQVVVYENFWRGTPSWLDALRGRADFTLVEHDVREPLPTDHGAFDWIIHAAGIATPAYYRKFPIETMDANINGLRGLLDQAAQQAQQHHPVRGFLFFSSSEIYGDPTADAIPTAEDYRGFVSCTGPRACYDESKRYGETLCVNFAQARGVPTRMARPFNNYGPGMKITDGRVIADFCRSVIEGRDIVMFSDGTPTRTFCYSADAVCGYYKALVRGDDGEPYNVGTDGPEISMSELARRITAIAAEQFGYAGMVKLGSSPEDNYLVDNPNRRCPDLTKSRGRLDYAPAVPLDEGLRRTLLWYGGNREGDER
ncbi:MAG TPA: NAD-dependent epimerase/dehydratase family protein [Acidimicrobiales bacterium]|nr:NAD-dependent epimerase/dehydratase family protein [Acidimicrobiales bacterium]